MIQHNHLKGIVKLLVCSQFLVAGFAASSCALATEHDVFDFGGSAKPLYVRAIRASFEFAPIEGSEIGTLGLDLEVDPDTDLFTVFCLRHDGSCLLFPSEVLSMIPAPQVGEFAIRIEDRHLRTENWQVWMTVSFGEAVATDVGFEWPRAVLTFNSNRLIRVDIYHPDPLQERLGVYLYEE